MKRTHCSQCNKKLLLHQKKYCSPTCKGVRCSTINKRKTYVKVMNPERSAERYMWRLYWKHKYNKSSMGEDERAMFAYAEYLFTFIEYENNKST